MTNLRSLKKITKELANEVLKDDSGPMFQLMTLFFDNIKTPVSIITPDYKLLYMNPIKKKMCLKKMKKGIDYCYKLFFNRKKACTYCPVRKTIRSRSVSTYSYDNGDGSKVKTTCIPLIYNGVSAVVQIQQEEKGTK